MLNRSKTWAGMVLLAAFASGLVVGGAATTAWAARRSHHASFAERLQSELTLTPSQHDSVDAILKSYQPRAHALFETYNAGFDSIRLAVRGRIAPLLTDAQRQRFQEITARGDSTRRAARTHDSATTHAR